MQYVVFGKSNKQWLKKNEQNNTKPINLFTILE